MGVCCIKEDSKDSALDSYNVRASTVLMKELQSNQTDLNRNSSDDPKAFLNNPIRRPYACKFLLIKSTLMIIHNKTSQRCLLHRPPLITFQKRKSVKLNKTERTQDQVTIPINLVDDPQILDSFKSNRMVKTRSLLQGRKSIFLLKRKALNSRKDMKARGISFGVQDFEEDEILSDEDLTKELQK